MGKIDRWTSLLIVGILAARHVQCKRSTRAPVAASMPAGGDAVFTVRCRVGLTVDEEAAEDQPVDEARRRGGEVAIRHLAVVAGWQRFPAREDDGRRGTPRYALGRSW
jgi:hypothetical protein